MLIRKCSGIDMALLAVQNGEGRVLHGYAGKVLTNLRRSDHESGNSQKVWRVRTLRLVNTKYPKHTPANKMFVLGS